MTVQQAIDPVTHDELRSIALRQRAWTLDCGKRLAHAAHTSCGLESPSDVRLALDLATRIHEHNGEIPAALELADEWVHCCELGHSDGSARAARARLLFKIGRVDEAMDDFEAARPYLTSSPGASWFLTKALADCGRADLAGQWLTDALLSVLHGPPQPDVDADRRDLLINMLASQRRMLRQQLDLTTDDFDELAGKAQDRTADWLAAARRRDSFVSQSSTDERAHSR